MKSPRPLCCLALSAIGLLPFGLRAASANEPQLKLNDLEYLEMPGLNVMLAHDFYPEGHQGGVGIIQNDQRIATNGDLRLEPTPGQWEAIPKVGKRQIDRATGEISVHMEYPDEERNRKGFNPTIYPNLNFGYTIRVRPEGQSFRIIVDLDGPLPGDWSDKVGFNLELFPGVLFGKDYYIDDHFGIFPRQSNGPGEVDQHFHDPEDPFATGYQDKPLGLGKRLTIVPESDSQRMTIEAVRGGQLQLLDGRAEHTNGWFVVRATTEKGATKNALEWLVTPHALANFLHTPVVQVSQVGYHPNQDKIAVVELDARDRTRHPIEVDRINETGGVEKVLSAEGQNWGHFLRYDYLQLDFSSIRKPGMYVVKYGDQQSAAFQINEAVYDRDVWQPTLEYFLPVQMCHMRINDRYRVWHDVCHLDDARMAPINYNHFDGYIQGPSTLTKYQPGEHVPGLDHGGWHDAGDYDLRIESQSETIYGLALAYENFHVNYDNTTIDQANHRVEIHSPDGKPDVLQQIEHGALTIVGGYKSLGRLYRGIQTATLRQYVLLGDAADMTDNKVYDQSKYKNTQPPAVGLPGSPDDNWVFTEDNPRRELMVASHLAASYRALKDLNPELANDCLHIAEELWDKTKEKNPGERISAAVELLITTNDQKYADFLKQHVDIIGEHFRYLGWVAARTLKLIDDQHYHQVFETAAKAYRAKIDELGKKTPYGVPYEPAIWGAGWTIQRFGVEQYFLHDALPDIFPDTYMLHALDFILGFHPGSNTSTFVSGVGAKSLIPGYGNNRADWSYIPGGIGSGTALIRPDFPELMDWPFFWQQREYVLGEGTSDYIFLVLAAQHELKK